MSELITIQPQEDFPLVDLTTSNADILELLLQNHETFYEAHKVAEYMSILYKLGHATLLSASQPHLLEYESKALSHGISTYEAIAACVCISERPEHDAMTIRPHLEMSYLTVNTNHKQTFESLPGLLYDQLPNASRVVAASAKRAHSGAVNLAIVGAALAYRLDASTITQAESK